MKGESPVMDLVRAVDEGTPSDGVGLISWASSNEEAFARIIRLYCRPGMTIADTTFGRGVFWRLVDASQFDGRFTDLANDGVDARNLPYGDDSMDAVVFDPPYRYVEARTQDGHTTEQYRLNTLARSGVDGVLDLYRDGIAEATRVLRTGGHLIVKCQDTAGDGKQYWIHHSVMDYCRASECEPVDLMVVVTERPPPTRWKRQRTFKKAHSYFVVARKGGYYPFGYRSMMRR